LKKIKGGQSPIHRTTQAKGKGAISWLFRDQHWIKEFVWWIMAPKCPLEYSEMIPDKILQQQLFKLNFNHKYNRHEKCNWQKVQNR
jgi:hypothetical protein